MALYNNGYRLGNTPFKRGLGALVSMYNGGGSALNNAMPTSAMRASYWLYGAQNGYPYGNLAPECWLLPQKGGALSMRPIGQGGMTADLIPSYPMAINLTGSSSLDAIGALVVSMLLAITGSGSFSASVVGDLDMTADLTGDGDLSASMTGITDLVVGLLGQGDLDATIRAWGDMEIDVVVTGTGLSTANVGAAVWNALASAMNESGTMGAKLNSAASGGVDLNALAEAVLGASVEGSLTLEQVLRVLLAVAAGETTIDGSVVTFRDAADTKDRVTAVMDGSERTSVTLDPS